MVRESFAARVIRAMVVVFVTCVVMGSRRILERLVMVEREESLEEKQREQTRGGPGNRRSRPDPHSFRQHMEECGAQHRPRRKAQVNLQTRVVEYRCQRNDPAQDAGREDGQASHARA